MAASDFWNNQESAQATVAQLKGLRMVVVPLKEALDSADDLDGLLEILERG
jgi:peptide chain release factor 2